MTTDIGIILSATSILIVMVCHLCTTVWWMAKITTTLTRLADDVKEAVKDIKGLMPRADCVKIHEHLEKQFESIWTEIKGKADK